MNAQNMHIKPSDTKGSVRPQRLCTWLNLIPVDEFIKNTPDKVLFLDSFVTVKKNGDGFEVLFEGKTSMQVHVAIGVIFVWYDDDLSASAPEFPSLYKELFPTKYITSAPTIFENTHVMDFVENGSDNLHFKVVHLWNHSKLYDHKVDEKTITLKQDTRFNYGACSFNPFIRLLSKVIPELELTHDYVYHGPGLAVVNATGKGSPEFHALVSLTPEGANRTRVYVTMGLSPTTFPAWTEKLYKLFSPKGYLCNHLCGLMANYIKNEFDVDAVIWKNRRWMREPNLVNSEKHLYDVIKWGETYYPKDFTYPPEIIKTDQDKQWHFLAPIAAVSKTVPNSFHVAGEELIGYLDSNNEVRIHSAYCPHQGAHLGHEAGGKIIDGTVRCPFHGFHFKATGECLGQNINNSKCLPGLELNNISHRVVDGVIEVFV